MLITKEELNKVLSVLPIGFNSLKWFSEQIGPFQQDVAYAIKHESIEAAQTKIKARFDESKVKQSKIHKDILKYVGPVGAYLISIHRNLKQHAGVSINIAIAELIQSQQLVKTKEEFVSIKPSSARRFPVGSAVVYEGKPAIVVAPSNDLIDTIDPDLLASTVLILAECGRVSRVDKSLVYIRPEIYAKSEGITVGWLTSAGVIIKTEYGSIVFSNPRLDAKYLVLFVKNGEILGKSFTSSIAGIKAYCSAKKKDFMGAVPIVYDVVLKYDAEEVLYA